MQFVQQKTGELMASLPGGAQKLTDEREIAILQARIDEVLVPPGAKKLPATLNGDIHNGVFYGSVGMQFEAGTGLIAGSANWHFHVPKVKVN